MPGGNLEMKKAEEGVSELAGVIAAVKTPRFSSALVQYISESCCFIVILMKPINMIPFIEQ